MYFYLAAKFSRKKEMAEKARLLESLGHTNMSSWVFGGEDGLDRPAIAEKDLKDIDYADTLILFTHEREDPQPGGGRFVEFGYAFALMKDVIVIGPDENVFITHPGVTRYDTWEEFLENHYDD